MNNRIFLVAYFKPDKRGIEFGLERIHLYTWGSTIEKARAMLKNFCDECGWYEGVILEEKEEGNPFFRGSREWYMQQPLGEMKQIPEPEFYKHCLNLIG